MSKIMRFTYYKTPLHKYTFRSPKIRKWVESRVSGKVLNLFAGYTLLDCDEVRNDMDRNAPADFHMDALEFCKLWHGGKFDFIILDPPYAYRKSMEMYGGRVCSPFNALKDEIVKILKPNGRVITFGYHSNSMGKSRGFEQEEILLMSHGGAIHDTIAVIERLVEEEKAYDQNLTSQN